VDKTRRESQPSCANEFARPCIVEGRQSYWFNEEICRQHLSSVGWASRVDRCVARYRNCTTASQRDSPAVDNPCTALRWLPGIGAHSIGTPESDRLSNTATYPLTDPRFILPHILVVVQSYCLFLAASTNHSMCTNLNINLVPDQLSSQPCRSYLARSNK
jgi:hypothetical protein